ncbi:hypothetical protein ACIA7S_28745 [Streptomyces sp. NPDC051643]|uniref:hypothetical protein n=1 Tax=Streptomyces sp. NPDC051643 TaxID=3365665 RepID=UPI0037A4620F
MKNYTFTTRNVTAGQRNDTGEMVLHTVGHVTTELVGMLPPELAEWEWATDALNTRGWDEELFRLTIRGWKVVHPEAGVVGLLFQGAGTRVHVEWYDPANEDFFSAGWSANLRHGTAQAVFARQTAGHGLPADVEPEPYKAPKPVHPVWLENGTVVRYHGSLAQLSGGTFRVESCYRTEECDLDCDGYALYRIGEWWPCAIHVGLNHVTALDAEPVAA